ncbi:MAG: isoleucine--tRNA ligase [Candidatus Pacebacteria bacterium]|nr:isoleucine--tRNA ligase [Candidatus Paceibacterota bacterium]
MPKVKTFRKPPNLPELEKEIEQFWKEDKTFEKSVEQRPEDDSFVFYDGPPFATGLPHYGHILASTIKDVFPRYQTMKGKRVERVWGWDCHGLPLENMIEKELGIDTKREIEEMGVGQFNQACQSTVLRYRDEWKKIISRLGRWVDMENDYKTMDQSYMESVWWVFKQLWDKGLVYHGHKPMHICPRCGTPLSNFEVTQGYQEIKDLGVTIKFQLSPGQEFQGLLTDEQEISLLAWTTTPWTLPGNSLLAVDPDLDYVLVKQDEQYFVLAAAQAQLVLSNSEDQSGDHGDYQLKAQFKGQELLDLTYQPVFEYYQDTEGAFRVVAADFITVDEGTGVVHVAPGFGEDDFYLGQKLGIELIQHVDAEGKFVASLGELAGLTVKPKHNPRETDQKVVALLEENGVLYKKELVDHTYPHCWRCDTPLLNYATDSWFVAVTKIKDQLVANNQDINWVPAHMKQGRFGNWLEGAVDWAVSRDRYWGAPLPVWQSQDGDFICLGSQDELEELSGQKVKDLHKHVIDQIEFEKDGKIYRRIPQVFDCWFESGSMPYAQYHYPFEDREQFKHRFPADFIAEGADQTRGWFYTLHVLATALSSGESTLGQSELGESVLPQENSSAFKNVVVTGIVLAKDGKKMSKRLKNYPDPVEVIDKYGSDALRLYLMQSPVVKAESLRFDKDKVAQLRRQVFVIWWNMISFYKLFADQSQDITSLLSQADHVMDRWLLSRLNSLTKKVTTSLDNYDLSTASRDLIGFVDQLSTWYLRLSRDRLRADDNQQVSQVFGAALYHLAKLYAPFTPFFSELVHHNLVNENSSIHLTNWPEAQEKVIDQQLEDEMKTVADIVEIGRSLRRDKQVKLRHPLASLELGLPDQIKYQAQLEQLLLEELNVKQVNWIKTDTLSVDYDYQLTPELKAEARARDLIREIQDLRRKAKLKLDDQAEVQVPDWPQDWQEEIQNRTNTTLVQGDELKLVE